MSYIEILAIPALIATGAGLAILLFAKFRKKKVRENPLIFEEEIEEHRQPLVVFAGGKRVSFARDETPDYGLPYIGRITWRKKYRDSLHVRIMDILSNEIVELNPVQLNTNLVIPEGIDLTGGQVIYFCNVDAANRVCEWNFTTAKRYVQQLSDISRASLENEVWNKVEEDIERQKTRLNVDDGISTTSTITKTEKAKQ